MEPIDHPDAIAAIENARCISLTTFKKDGTAVSTPIWFNVLDGRIVVTTEAKAWKTKRIANNPQVQFATCTMRGKVTGPAFDATARLLPASELPRVMAAKKRRYVTARLIQMMPSKRDQVAIEITPVR